MHSDFLRDDRVLVRTAVGGRYAAFDEVELDTFQRRLLRMVNGYTPLDHLIRLLGQRDGCDWRLVASQLMARGLVVVVDWSTEAGRT